MKIVIFRNYVSLPEGLCSHHFSIFGHLASPETHRRFGGIGQELKSQRDAAQDELREIAPWHSNRTAGVNGKGHRIQNIKQTLGALWQTNIAMENGPCIGDSAIKDGDFP